MKNIGLRFIGVVKTATKRFPSAKLHSIELQNRGDLKGLLTTTPDGTRFLAFVWMDRERRYFIASCSSLLPGNIFVRKRWRQINPAVNADPENVVLEVPQPKAAEIYYSCCGKVDQNNRHRQDTLRIEHKIETNNWAARVNMSIVAMCLVDTWMVWKLATESNQKQPDFYRDLSEEMIDNTFDAGGTTRHVWREQIRPRTSTDSSLFSRSTGSIRGGIRAHLTPTKKKRKKRDGTLTNLAKQGYCIECKMKTKYLCSECVDDDPHEENGETYLCGSETNRTCFADHMTKAHECST